MYFRVNNFVFFFCCCCCCWKHSHELPCVIINLHVCVGRIFRICVCGCVCVCVWLCVWVYKRANIFRFSKHDFIDRLAMVALELQKNGKHIRALCMYYTSMPPSPYLREQRVLFCLERDAIINSTTFPTTIVIIIIVSQHHHQY